MSRARLACSLDQWRVSVDTVVINSCREPELTRSSRSSTVLLQLSVACCNQVYFATTPFIISDIYSPLPVPILSWLVFASVL